MRDHAYGAAKPRPDHSPFTIHHSRSSERGGLTVIEVLLALVLTAIGLLGVAGASALALRTTTEAILEHRAHRQLAARLATLTASGCAGARSGAAAASGDRLSERWTVLAPPDSAAVLVEVRADWIAAGRPRSLAVEGAVLC